MNSRYENVVIFQWNANSLRSKSADFRKLVAQYSFPVLCIQEAGVRDDFRISNYITYKSSRPSGNSRTMLCVRKDLPSHLIQSSSSDFPEYVACKVYLAKKCITIVSIYLQASRRITTDELISIFSITRSNIFICGDFNAHNVTWGE